jgi:hypothetical protein
MATAGMAQSGLRLYRAGSNPLDRFERFQVTSHSPFHDFSCRKGGLCQAPVRKTEQVLADLGRCTHRVALANSRLTRLGDGQADFTWKDYRLHGKTKVMTRSLPTSSFGGSCCTPCRTGSTASAMSASRRTAIAPQSWRCAVPCSQLRRQIRQTPENYRGSDPPADRPRTRPLPRRPQ